jgi:hypothetical protein
VGFPLVETKYASPTVPYRTIEDYNNDQPVRFRHRFDLNSFAPRPLQTLKPNA